MNIDPMFLGVKSTILPDEVLIILENYDSSNISEGDKEIAKEIYDYIENNNTLPHWWTPQESVYIEKAADPEVLIPYIVFRYKFNVFPAKKIWPEFPLYVLIEPTSVCNLRCPFCFQSDKSFTVKSNMGMMEMDLFVQCVDECEANGTCAITLASRGEPTLHPQFTDMLKYLKGKFLELKIILMEHG